METDSDRRQSVIRSFSFKCLVTPREVYLVGPAESMMAFFGTTEDSYRNGMISRIRKDISGESADTIMKLITEKSSSGEDFRLIYPSKRADGSDCVIQMDGYAKEKTDDGRYYDVIDLDVTELHEAKEKADKLAKVNGMLLEDSPVGLGLYYIKNDRFELLYTNKEYYNVHRGSREFWDRFNGGDAMDRISPEDHEAVTREWLRVKGRPGEIFDGRYRCVGEDGRKHWIRLVARVAEPNPDGSYYCYAAYYNIDSEIEAEEKAELLNQKMLDTVTGMPATAALFTLGADESVTAVSVSEQLCELLGYEHGRLWDMYADSPGRIIHPDDYPAVHAAMLKQETIEFRMLTSAGEYIWVNTNEASFTVEDTKYLYVVYHNIDHIKKQEEEIKHQYNNAQSFLDSLSGSYEAMFRASLTRNAVEMINGSNPAISVDDTLSYDDMLRSTMHSLARESDREKYADVFDRKNLIAAFERGERMAKLDYFFRPAEGKSFWAEASANIVKSPDTDDIVIFCVVSDITDTKIPDMIKNKIIIEECDFVSYIDVSESKVKLISTNENASEVGRYYSENAADPDAGTDYAEIITKYDMEYVAEEDRERCLEFMKLDNVVKALKTSNRYTGTFIVNENGERRYKRMDYYYIDQELDLITMLRTDITEIQNERISQEEKLRTALLTAQQASMAKSEFLSRMSHEIRTPMNAIIGLNAIALKEPDLSPAVRNSLSKIGISARFLLSLINDILDMSRIESGKMVLIEKEFNFRRMIDSINTILYSQCTENGIDYECVIKGFTEEAYIGDEMKLEQVLINILGNSVKFTKPGGKIHFMIEQLSHSRDSATLRFTIADTGIGIDESYLPHIFDAFSQEEGGTTTSYSGTGLGLAICRSLVELMDGSIDVHSIKGMGTDFTVDVNVGLPEERVRWNRAVASSASDIRSLKTLIVDDDIIVCEHAEIVLRDAGLRSEYVLSGAEAVELVHRRHEAGDEFDLILVDWKMPDMDGIETAKRIREIVGDDVTILIITAYEWSDIEQKARAAGVNNFMRKPIFASSVIQIYDETRAGRKSEDEGEKTYDFTGMNILLAEDNLINAEITTKLLEMAGFSVTVAENGVEVIKDFSEVPDGHYAAILMDIRMPLMDGLEATEVIRKIKKKDSASIPIIAMSANAFAEDVEKSMASGMNAHLSKPVNADDMYRVLDEEIRRIEKDKEQEKDK